MKNFKIIGSKAILACGVLSVLTLNSCKKDFESINDDPNNPKDVPNDFLLVGAMRGLMDNTTDVWWGANMGNQLAQYWSSNQYSSESRYNFRTQITNSYWGLFYAGGNNDASAAVGGLVELNRIIDNCKNDPGPSSAYGFPGNQIAAATILRVWLIQNMTDAWGNIPYSEALAPALSRTPKYDSQEAVYNGMISELNAALAGIDLNEAGPTRDLIYDGDMSLWAKFGNALKMRVALRMADVNGTAAKTSFEEAATAGVFSSNADNALLRYGDFPSANMIYFNYEIDARNDYAASNTFLDNTLTPLNDPRRDAFFLPNDDAGVFIGEVYGLTEANAAATPNSSISQRSELTLSASLPGIYMDYAQVEFMLAEAVERGWSVPGSADGHYTAGITASIEYWTDLNGSPATQTDIDNYIAQPSVNYATAPGTYKEKIGKQKWIALFNQGIQGWAEWRRLDFGILQLPADGLLEGNGIPKRMKYAIDEQTLNSANYAAAVSAQGPDDQDTKLWWDVN